MLQSWQYCARVRPWIAMASAYLLAIQMALSAFVPATAAIAMVETGTARHRYGRRQAYAARWCADRPQSLVLIKRHLLRLRRRSRTRSGHATNISWRIFLPAADILAALREPVDPLI